MNIVTYEIPSSGCPLQAELVRFRHEDIRTFESMALKDDNTLFVLIKLTSQLTSKENTILEIPLGLGALIGGQILT